MKSFKSFFVVALFFTLGISPLSRVSAEEMGTNSKSSFSQMTTKPDTAEIVPFKTSYGNGGYTKIELYGGGREVWWSVKPNTTQNYTYSGLITVTFSDNTNRIYTVSKSGKGGQAVSGSFSLPKKAKAAGINGIAYGPGGIQISIPTID